VNAEIADTAFEQQGANGVGHAADADLQAGAIFNLDGDAARNGAIDFARLRIWQLRRWIAVAFDDVIDFAEMNAVLVSAGIGEAFAHLDNHHPGAFNHGAVPHIGGTEVEAAVLVHGACLEDDDVNRIEEAAVIVGDFAEVERHVVAAAGVVSFPVVAGEMPTEKKEMPAVGIAFSNSPRPHGEAGTDFYVLEGVSSGGERLIEHVGLTEPHPVIEPHARANEVRGLVAGDGLCGNASYPADHARPLSMPG